MAIRRRRARRRRRDRKDADRRHLDRHLAGDCERGEEGPAQQRVEEPHDGEGRSDRRHRRALDPAADQGDLRDLASARRQERVQRDTRQIGARDRRHRHRDDPDMRPRARSARSVHAARGPASWSTRARQEETAVQVRHLRGGSVHRLQAPLEEVHAAASGAARPEMAPGRSLIRPSTPSRTSSAARARSFTGQVMTTSATRRSSVTAARSSRRSWIDTPSIVRRGRSSEQLAELPRRPDRVHAANRQTLEPLEQRPGARADGERAARRDTASAPRPRRSARRGSPALEVEHQLGRRRRRAPGARRAAAAVARAPRAAGGPSRAAAARASSGGEPRRDRGRDRRPPRPPRRRTPPRPHAAARGGCRRGARRQRASGASE